MHPQLPLTHEDVIAAGNARSEDQRRREERYRQRRRLMTYRLARAGGSAALCAALVMRFAHSLSWISVALLVATGAAAGLAIGRLRWGILRGMLLYGLGVSLVQVLSGMILNSNHPLAVGPAIMFLTALIWHVVIGALLGFINDQFDNDHILI